MLCPSEALEEKSRVTSNIKGLVNPGVRAVAGHTGPRRGRGLSEEGRATGHPEPLGPQNI